MRILLVEDEDHLAELVVSGLVKAGFTIDSVNAAGDALAAAAGVRYEAIILDLGLPDEDGMQVLTCLRRDKITTPILVLTARGNLEDRVAGLDAGADDYLLKPFAMVELIARLKALLRRPSGALGLQLEAGNLSFDTIARETRVDNVAVPFSGRELGLLEHLMRRAGHVVPKNAIEDSLYGFGEEVGSNSVEVLVHRLRRRLEESGASVAIHTVRGVGYLLADGPM